MSATVPPKASQDERATRCDSYNVRLPFCTPTRDRVFYRSDLGLGLWDAHPVSPGHALLVTTCHVESWFDATPGEQAALLSAITMARKAVEARFAPTGYNIGVNVGAAAGQTVPHLHVHLIPRYPGDVPDPAGGVRHVIPHRAKYPFHEYDPDSAP